MVQGKVMDFQRLKTLRDFESLTAPIPILDDSLAQVGNCLPIKDQMILRMLVRPKYGEFFFPSELRWLAYFAQRLFDYDTFLTGIQNKWCYITVRHGVEVNPDNSWHLDGGSLRVELIPERNYIWVSDYGFEYKTGTHQFPTGFDPVKENLFPHIEHGLREEYIIQALAWQWYLVHPFVFHRRNPRANGQPRTFIRVTFPDIEIRDVNCTPNPILPTKPWGRDPVKSFRNGLR